MSESLCPMWAARGGGCAIGQRCLPPIEGNHRPARQTGFRIRQSASLGVGEAIGPGQHIFLQDPPGSLRFLE